MRINPNDILPRMTDALQTIFGFGLKPTPKVPVVLATRFGENSRSFLTDHGPVASDQQWYLVKVDGHEVQFQDHPASMNLFDHNKDKYKLLILDFGNKLFMQDKFKGSMHGYFESAGLRALDRKVPLLLVADRDTLNETGTWKRAHEYATAIVEKPANLLDLEHAVRECTKLTPASKPRIRLENVTDEFIRFLRDYGRKAASRYSLAFPKGQRVVVQGPEPFAVTYDDNATLSTPTERWLDIEPAPPTKLGALHLLVRDWVYQYNSNANGSLKSKLYAEIKK
jgi:hypothetical protein